MLKTVTPGSQLMHWKKTEYITKMDQYSTLLLGFTLVQRGNGSSIPKIRQKCVFFCSFAAKAPTCQGNLGEGIAFHFQPIAIWKLGGGVSHAIWGLLLKLFNNLF
jgi:hypothetical protein